MKKRKVMFLATTATAGGIDSVSTRLATGLMERGSDVIYVTHRIGAIRQHCIELGIPNESLLINNSGDLPAIIKIAEMVRNHRPDVIHVHSRRDFIPAALGARLAGRQLHMSPKVVLHLHLHKVMGAPARLAGWFFQRISDKAVAVSNAVRDYVIKTHNLHSDYVETIYNGIIVPDYLPPDSSDYAKIRREQRAAWGIPDDAPMIGMIGRFAVKGQHVMIDLLPRLLQDLPNVRLVLIGADTGKNTDRKEAPYRDAAEAMGVSDKVVVTGLSENVPELLPALDLLLHLPVNEAFGLALVEAMASGVPVITSDIPGCREVIDLTEGGIAIDPTDQSAILASLKKMLDPISGPPLRQEYGARGRKAVLERFAMPAQIDAIEDLYDRLCDGQR